VTVTVPEAVVVPELALRVPHEPAWLGLRAKVTVSPAIAAAVTPSCTVATTVEVAEPLAGTAPGVADRAMVFGTLV
jgi:hypothetical protein